MTDRSLTIRELAKAAKVSIGTVSRALKGQPGLSAQTRAAVLRVAQELGYDLGRLRSGRPRRVLFLYNRHIDSLATNQFYSVVLHGAETACRENGISLSLLSLGPGDDVAAQVRRHEAEALLAVGFFENETLAAMRASELPVALADHFHPGVRCINVDNIQGGLLATRHLLEGGARRPAMIVGPMSHHSVALRVRGFRRALFEASRLADPDLEMAMDMTLAYDEAGRDAMRRLLALPQPPDGVFAYNDLTALGAIEVCKAAGLRVPEDIRVVGYDDIAASARSHPSLTTVRIDKDALGREAVLALMDGDMTPRELLLPVDLIVRESSRSGPASRGRGRQGHRAMPDRLQPSTSR